MNNNPLLKVKLAQFNVVYYTCRPFTEFENESLIEFNSIHSKRPKSYPFYKKISRITIDFNYEI